MWKVMQHRGLRSVFAANMISMLGSGLNAAAVTWTILQRTRSEMNLAYLVILMTIPAMLMMPFSGVVIDREDRRRLVMLLDAGRGAVIACVAVMALRHQVQLWHLYLMNTLVALGFWMFWPTITALIQELTPESAFVQSNTLLLAGVQAGWLLAGALVGFVYNSIGLGGVLIIDCCTYVVSFSCYLMVRKGRHVVHEPHKLADDIHAAEGAVARFFRELHDGVRYIAHNRYILLVGTSWFLFIGAMMTQNVLTAPMSDRVLHAGAVGYGWLNMGWGVGAFASVFYTPLALRRLGARRSIAFSLSLMALGLCVVPRFAWIILAVAIYVVMGSARGVGGVAISSTIMEIVPKQLMGRVQNTFLFAGTALQLVLAYVVGIVAQRVSLLMGFVIVATTYAIGALASVLPVKTPKPAQAAGAAPAQAD